MDDELTKMVLVMVLVEAVEMDGGLAFCFS
jgi:hypothetical protein